MDQQQLQDRLNAYVAAELAILNGAQEYDVMPGDGSRRRVRYADLQQIRDEIQRLRLLVQQQTATRGPRFVRLC